MTNDFTLEQISADGINNNFSTLKNVIQTKADLNGDDTQRFKVADAIEALEAINKEQLDSSISTISSEITNLGIEIESELTTKLDKNDVTVTKQGNTFNCADQLVRLDSNGKLPILDGSKLTKINSATLDTSNMPNMANNVANPNTQIDFSSGFCFDDTLIAKMVSTGMTKKLDAVFVEGTGNGGLDTGSKTISTKYAVFIIAKTDGTSDFLFSLNATTPTMPTGYIYKRRIGWIITNSSGNIIQFLQDGDNFHFQTVVGVYDGNCSPAYTNITMPVPPNTELMFEVTIRTGAIATLWIKSSVINRRGVYNYVSNYLTSRGSILLGQDAIFSFATDTSTTIVIATAGYIDKRGTK